MKIRNGFVSNSSSSSFTCEICQNDFDLPNGCFDDGADDVNTRACGKCIDMLVDRYIKSLGPKWDALEQRVAILEKTIKEQNEN